MIVYSQEMHSNLSHTKFLEAQVYTIQPNIRFKRSNSISFYNIIRKQ